MNDIDKNGRPGRSKLSRRHLIQRAAGIGLLGTGFDRLMNVRWIDPAAAATYDPKKSSTGTGRADRKDLPNR